MAKVRAQGLKHGILCSPVLREPRVSDTAGVIEPDKTQFRNLSLLLALGRK